MFVIGLFFFSLFSLATFYNFYYKRRNLPPGPIPLPLVGNILTIIRKKPGEDAFLKWKREYGPIYTYWLGELAVVCVADYDKIVEVFQKGGEEFCGRFQFVDFTIAYRGGPYGIFFTEGTFWKDHRKFAANAFRQFGVNSNLMEEKILKELNTMFKRIDKQFLVNSSTVLEDYSIVNDIEISIGSIINCLLFGYAYDTEELIEEFNEVLGLFMKGFSVAYEKRLGSLFSTLLLCSPKTFKDLPLFKQRYEALMGTSRGLRTFFERRIQKRMQKMNYSDPECNDFVEAYLKERAKREKEMAGGEHSFSLEQLWNICMDLWISGQETTTTVLSWGIAHCLHNSEVSNKLYAELDSLIGDSDRLISMADRPKLPYTNALINEFLRISNMIVQNCYRRVLDDVKIGEFRIKKGTCILPQISVVLADDEIFQNPKMFNPDRFLNENNNFVRCEKLIPFSVGKRKCFAESMARMELFLFTANIFNRYRLSMGNVPPSLKRELGITIHCPHFTCKIERR